MCTSFGHFNLLNITIYELNIIFGILNSESCKIFNNVYLLLFWKFSQFQQCTSIIVEFRQVRKTFTIYIILGWVMICRGRLDSLSEYCLHNLHILLCVQDGRVVLDQLTLGYAPFSDQSKRYEILLLNINLSIRTNIHLCSRTLLGKLVQGFVRQG